MATQALKDSSDVVIKIQLHTPMQFVGMTETVYDSTKSSNIQFEETARGVIMLKTFPKEPSRKSVKVLFPWGNLAAVQYGVE